MYYTNDIGMFLRFKSKIYNIYESKSYICSWAQYIDKSAFSVTYEGDLCLYTKE